MLAEYSRINCLLVILFISCGLARTQLEENDSCEIKSHAGICAVQRNCPHLRVTMDSWGLSKEDVVSCGFTIYEEIICCPISRTTMSPKFAPAIGAGSISPNKFIRNFDRPAKRENDSCEIKSHAGICAVQRNCPHLRVTMDLWGLSKEDVFHCGFTIHEEIICCPKVMDSSDSPAHENDPCVIKSHSGICAVQRNCLHLEKTMGLWGLSKEDVVSCGFTIYEEIICCPNTTTTKSPIFAPAIGTGSISSNGFIRNFGRAAKRACQNIEERRSADLIPLIYGGKKGAPGEYPHMVRLVYDDDNFRCGGTLISKRFVLTAAHCIELREGKLISAILGVTDFNNTEEYNSRQEFKIKATYPHHNYSTHYHYFDIGLIELERDAEFGENVYPTCLSTNESDFTAGTELVVTGWGLTENQKLPTHLMEAKVKILPVSQCNITYKDEMGIRLNHGIDETQLCAFAPGRDACEGDSGGPLHFVKDKGYGNYRVVGVVALGQGCGVVPGVYTRVIEFLDFIEGIVWPGPV